MANREIHDGSEQATQQTNTVDVLTPILEIQPKVGTTLTFKNRVPNGVEPGLPTFFKLKDSSGNDLPRDTEFLLTKQEPTDDDTMPISVRETNIGYWNDTSVIDQQDKDRIDSFKHELQRDFYTFHDDDKLFVEILSSAQVDWANSELHFKSSGVEEQRDNR